MAKKNRIRICIVMIVICMMGFSDWTFAAEEEKTFEILGISLNIILSFFSWFWVILAKVAGTFLTNKWVYGEVFGFDALLWKYWNLMKNIANFGLGFYFVYVIFKGLIKQGKEDITKNLKKIIIWILVAGVGIQSSWFFTAAIIDVSTITLSAAGAFPSQVISENPYFGDKLRKTSSEFVNLQTDQVVTGMKITINDPVKNDGSYVKTEYVEIANKQDFSGLVDRLMPNADDISGPLYYIGYFVLKPQFIATPTTSDIEVVKNVIMNLIIQGGTTIVFTIEMLVLCVLALMRILYLWMFIIMSPIAILLRCIQQSGRKGDDKSFISTLMKQINFKSFFINVFKPTIVVLGLGISLMFIVLIQSVIKETPDRKPIVLNGVTITSFSENDSNVKDTGNQGDKTHTTMIDSQFVHFTLAHSAKTFMEMILCVVTVIIIYFIVKVAMNMGDGKDFVSEKIKKVQDAAETALTTLPVVPVSGYDDKGKKETHALSVGQAFGLGGKTSILEKTIQNYQGEVQDRYNKQNQIIDSWFGDGSKTGYLSADERGKIKNATGVGGMGILDAKKLAIFSIRDDKENKDGKGMTLNPATSKNDGFWIEQFEQWLDDRVKNNDYNSMVPDWRNMIISWQNLGDKKSLQNLFGNTVNVQTYAKYFFDSDDDRYKISTWNDLKDADISKKKSDEKSE